MARHKRKGKGVLAEKETPPKENRETILISLTVEFQTAARMVIADGDIPPYPLTKKQSETLVKARLAPQGKAVVRATGYRLWTEASGNGQLPTSPEE